VRRLGRSAHAGQFLAERRQPLRCLGVDGMGVHATHAQGIAQTVVMMTSLPGATWPRFSMWIPRSTLRTLTRQSASRSELSATGHAVPSVCSGAKSILPLTGMGSVAGQPPIDGRTRTLADERFPDMGRTRRSQLRRWFPRRLVCSG
jgi:hypothetical protein